MAGRRNCHVGSAVYDVSLIIVGQVVPQMLDQVVFIEANLPTQNALGSEVEIGALVNDVVACVCCVVMTESSRNGVT